MSKPVSLDRLREISRQRPAHFIRQDAMTAKKSDRRCEAAGATVEWPIPN
jgi:hypothetical protein